MRGTFAALPSHWQSRLEHLPLTVSEQAFGKGTLDRGRLKDLRAISVEICTVNETRLSPHTFSLLATSTDGLLPRYHSPHFIFRSLLFIFDALVIKASYTRYVSFRDIQAPAVLEASPASRTCDCTITADIVTPSVFQSIHYRNVMSC